MRYTIASRRGDRISLALVLSYVFDWVIILAEAAIGVVFGNRSPNKRPFSLADPNISFPFTEKETISSTLLFVISLIVPGVVILLVTLLVVPGPTVPKSTPKSLIWRRKLWEWFIGWTGLGLSSATAWIITNGMKNLFGHYRPDMLSRCNPDLANIANYAVGGIPNTAQGVSIVTWKICQATDQSHLDDGFRSFPSGHSSSSAAGLVYLSLFLASKLAITIPFLAPRPYGNEAAYFSAFPSRLSTKPVRSKRYDTSADQSYKMGESIEMSPVGISTSSSNSGFPTIAARNQSAAPPVYLLVFVVAPIMAAVYVASTRYSEFRHFGFDILFGFSLGTLTAYFSFRFYQLPISRGAGWAWGPRSRDHAFWAGMGVGTYATNRVENPLIRHSASNSLEPLHGDAEVAMSPTGHFPTERDNEVAVHDTAYDAPVPARNVGRNIPVEDQSA